MTWGSRISPCSVFNVAYVIRVPGLELYKFAMKSSEKFRSCLMLTEK